MASPGDAKFLFVEIFCFVVGVSGCLLLKIDNAQPTAYMDEIFHIPQAQQYCMGHFEKWDPMITTLPGLYWTSVAALRPLAWLFDIPMKKACSTFRLRCINVVFTAGILCLLYLLTKKIHGKSDSRSVLTALAMTLLPVLYFFSFLYYTDPGSTFFILLAYLFCLHSRHLPAAIAGAVAILFRQTNVIWVIFCAGNVVADELMKLYQPQKKEVSTHDLNFLMAILKRLWRLSLSELFRFVAAVVGTAWPYVLVGFGFVAFIVINGGIVVGAKDDHQVALHLAQALYFTAFTGFFACVYLASPRHFVGFLTFIRTQALRVLILSVVFFIAVKYFTVTHRYLLSDNRHYTFYVWSKMLSRHELIRLGLIPGYIYAAWSMAHSLNKDILWKTLFTICTLASLVPSPLLEFRYFTVPYIIFRLHLPLGSCQQLAAEIALSALVNVVSLYVFVNLPFKWEDSEYDQRFMW